MTTYFVVPASTIIYNSPGSVNLFTTFLFLVSGRFQLYICAFIIFNRETVVRVTGGMKVKADRDEVT